MLWLCSSYDSWMNHSLKWRLFRYHRHRDLHATNQFLSNMAPHPLTCRVSAPPNTETCGLTFRQMSDILPLFVSIGLSRHFDSPSHTYMHSCIGIHILRLVTVYSCSLFEGILLDKHVVCLMIIINQLLSKLFIVIIIILLIIINSITQ